MNRHGCIDEADLVRELNARRVKRGDAVANVLLAAAIGVFGALALIHWWSA